MKPKFAILGGAGSIGRRHAKNLMSLDYQLRIWDTNMDYKLTREETIAGADAVIICTPTRQHMNDMMDCQGKHILVEKPMAFDMPGPGLLGFYLGKKSRKEVVAVGNNLRFHQCVLTAKQMIDNGTLGKVGWAEFKVLQKTEKPAYLMDGVSRNWGAHEIDLALHLLGPGQAREIIRVEKVDDNDVAIEFTMAHESGGFSTISMDYLTEPEQRGFKLVGSKGVLEADLVKRTLTHNCQHHDPLTQQMTDSWDENYLNELKTFIKCIELGSIPKASPLASGSEGAACMDVILSVRSMAGLVDKEPDDSK